MCGYEFMPTDYCYTRRNESTLEIAACIKDSDCSSCWPCATTCFVTDENKLVSQEIMQQQIVKKTMTAIREI